MKCLLQFCQIVNIDLKEKRLFQEGCMFQYQSKYHASSENKRYRNLFITQYLTILIAKLLNLKFFLVYSTSQRFSICEKMSLILEIFENMQ